MSIVSDIFSGEELMKWREPNAYTRKDLSNGGWIGLLIVFMVPALLLIISAVNHDFSKGRIILALFLIAVGALLFVGVWFGPGSWVCLTGDHISRATSRPARRTRYGNIEECIVSHESYNDVQFSVLKFTLKKGLPVGQVEKIVVPNDIDVEQVLQILRNKGIKIKIGAKKGVSPSN
jgi:hypothetical protein